MNNLQIEFVNSENKEELSDEELKDVDISLLSNFRHEINTQRLLYDSCINNNYALLQKLIDIDADINIKNNFGSTALMGACIHNSYECAKLLIENNADINAQSNFGTTALMYACMFYSFECAKFIIENNVDVNVKNSNGYTALMYAETRNKETVDLLIKNGAHE